MAKKVSILSTFNEHDEIESYIISINGERKEIPIYKKDSGITIELAESRISTLRRFFEKSLNGNLKIICNDFKKHLKALNLPLDNPNYEVYQPPLNELSNGKDIIGYFDDLHPKDYQKILANSNVVYQSLENNGLYINYELMHPLYSTDTFSGRSKAKFFNIQGYTADDHIRSPHVDENDILILFDWISADIRVASIMSEDSNLDESFSVSDPYTYMADKINKESEGEITREECKIFLLKSINSMDWTGDVINEIYPELARWIRKCDYRLNEEDAFLSTILGKRFYIKDSKNKLAVLNGTMQGSVAHAMHNTLIQLHSIIPHRIVCDIHDSLVINSPPSSKDINKYINIVVDIMSLPFAGYLPKQYKFPIKVSIGKKWKKWKFYKIIR